jgi:hypothetical protein
MARVTGLEPATSGVTGRHSNQLSYTRTFPERDRITARCEASFRRFVFGCQGKADTNVMIIQGNCISRQTNEIPR